MLQGTNWALCSCGPSPWPILQKDSPKYSSQMSNEWEFSCIAQMMQPFPLKYTHRVFPPIKVWSIKKFFILRFQIPPVGNCCSFSSSTMSHLVQWKHSSEREGWRCFSENHLRPSWKGKKKKKGLLFHLLPWRISPHVKLQSKVKAFACVPWWFQQKESCPGLPSKLWTSTCWTGAQQTN